MAVRLPGFGTKTRVRMKLAGSLLWRKRRVHFTCRKENELLTQLQKGVSSSSHWDCSPVFPGLLFPTMNGIKHLPPWYLFSRPCDWLWPVKHDWEWRVPLLGKRQKIWGCSTWFAIFPFPCHGDWWRFRRCRLWQPSHQVRTMQSRKLRSPEMRM